jgi:hypothetical protein
VKTRTAVLLSALSFLCATPAAYAQESTGPAATTPATDPNAVRRDLYDLALLRALQSVNLSEDQIKAMATVIQETLETDKARRAKDDDAMREIAAEVKKAREGAVGGEPIPTELETRFTDIQKAITARFGAAKRAAVEKVLAVLWPTLTDAQKTEMEKQSIAFYGGKRVPAAYRSKPKEAPREEVLKLAAGAFVENVLLEDRTVTLLKTLKPLKSASPDNAKGSEPAATPDKP